MEGCGGMRYLGSTMKKITRPAKKRAAAPRAGRTEKISISLDTEDVRTLRERAEKLYGGNLSAAVAEGVRRVREEAGREALVAWLGSAGESRPEEREAIRAEWSHERPKRRRVASTASRSTPAR
jgi:hypothetical protein